MKMMMYRIPTIGSAASTTMKRIETRTCIAFKSMTIFIFSLSNELGEPLVSQHTFFLKRE